MKKSLKENLQYLKLPRILEIHQEEAKKAAKEDLSYLEFLEKLIQEEATAKLERSIKAKIIGARFPVIKTLDNFDFNYPKSIKKQQILKLLDLEFVRAKENIIILGPPGVGKSHIASAIGYKACLAGIPTLFTSAIDIVNNLYASLSDNSFLKKMKYYTSPQLLVIDELGYLPLDKKGSDLFFQLISKRYERGSIILTSNRAFKDWEKIFNDKTTASAVVDRLIHHCELLLIEGESYRLKDKKKKSLVGK